MSIPEKPANPTPQPSFCAAPQVDICATALAPPPAERAGDISYLELFDIDELQRLQDQFSAATHVASVITLPNGTPITKPSNFCRLCADVVRKQDLGRINCYKSDAELGRLIEDGPTVQRCLSAGLWDAGAAIAVGGKHVANWLIGQVRDETQREEDIEAYARKIGANPKLAVEAFREVPAMKRDQFENVANFLYTAAQKLSETAYQNLLLSRHIIEKDQAERQLLINNHELRRSRRATLVALANLAEHLDEDTGDHVIRVALLSHEIARQLKDDQTSQQLTKELCENIAIASMLHDVGKVTIPDRILQKPGPLAEEEIRTMRQHATAGAKILRKSMALGPYNTYLELAASITESHHECYDGSGYPRGLRGDDIPIAARIVQVADVYDALTTPRPYRSAWTPDEVRAYLRSHAGSQFDPVIVDAALAVLAERAASDTTLVWMPEMSLGDPQLDQEHRIILGLFNQMAAPRNRDDRIVQEFVIDELLGYTESHLSPAKIMGDEVNHEDREARCRQYRQLKRRLEQIRTDFLFGLTGVGDEARELLLHWITKDIFRDEQYQ